MRLVRRIAAIGTGLTPGLALSLALGLVLTGCLGPGSLTVSDPWTRPTAPGAELGAFYLVVQNRSDVTDQLLGAESDRCSDTELHITALRGTVTSMGPATAADLRVEAGEDLVMEPGGLHVMCAGLRAPIIAGERLSVVLHFAEAGAITVEAVAEQR